VGAHRKKPAFYIRSAGFFVFQKRVRNTRGTVHVTYL